MTPLREELARAICEKDCARLRIGLPPCVDERGINAPCRGNQMQREVNYGRFADAALAILTREIAAARKAAIDEVTAAFDEYDAETKKVPLGAESKSHGRSIYNWRKHCSSELRAAAIRKLGEG